MTKRTSLPQEPGDLIYYLPIDQTLAQKELVELMVQLHRKSILKSLGKLKVEETGSTVDADGNPYLNDNVMLETFVSCVREIDNHPTLLVNHFIPRNLLLLDTKSNIISSSLKYVTLDNILNKLTERGKPKTLIISVSNGKELDLVESILIGKNGLQYYRFSGASIYYENHGSFNFAKNPVKPPERQHRDSSPESKHSGSNSRSSTPSSRSSGHVRRRRAKGSHEKAKRGQHSHKGPRRSRSKSRAGASKHKKTDDYTPRISKNSPLFAKIEAEKHNTKLNVYLILSNQLKYLTQFEELKSDFIITLDSNLKQVAPKPDQVPIIKMVIPNSLEYFDQQLQREVPTLKSSPEIYNKFLTYLTVAYRANVASNDDSAAYVSPGLIDWMLDIQHTPFPDDIRIPDFPVAGLRIEELTLRCVESMQSVQHEQPYEIEKYEFYDASLKFPHAKNEHKRQKMDLAEIPDKVSYRQYQKLLAKMVYERCKDLDHVISEKRDNLAVIHEDESRRQYTLETSNASIGAMYKSFRTARTNDESMGKHLERLTSDESKLLSMLDVEKRRLEEYRLKLGQDVTEDEERSKQKVLEDLQKQLADLEIVADKNEKENDALRAEYQTCSSQAADMSTRLEAYGEKVKRLEKESDGLSGKLEEKRLDDEIGEIERRTQAYDRDNAFLEKYIDHLDMLLKQRIKQGPQSLRRTSRSVSPY
ncbi:hypothetical protein BRETT_000453 [Brettanomyces bruxellensis]|uniref:HDA1 complex subunit 2 n=1 Tax=Dekkera bruxellensis TaxID=5007 RepID=A0A871RF73_DEKBR|nr:uncharacterized protein BRETT_000453 [Brettanomyces bruxellensis]QOU20740.1 hypothetical protein BRETT_000453 [Brettanomyces bruxellensis]